MSIINDFKNFINNFKFELITKINVDKNYRLNNNLLMLKY